MRWLGFALFGVLASSLAWARENQLTPSLNQATIGLERARIFTGDTLASDDLLSNVLGLLMALCVLFALSFFKGTKPGRRSGI